MTREDFLLQMQVREILGLDLATAVEFIDQTKKLVEDLDSDFDMLVRLLKAQLVIVRSLRESSLKTKKE